jgi:uncharacterized membrane protein YphA (DoxX/SURF4 family)
MSSRIDNISIPDKDSPCESWKLYFEALSKKYGAANAREAWLYTFNQSGNTSCTKDKAFNAWATKNKVGVADGVDKAIAGVSGIGQNIIGGIGTLTGLTPKLAAVALSGSLAIVFFLLYRISKQLKVSDMVSALPSGRAVSIAKQLKK